MRLAVIGFGNMGHAVVHGAVEARVLQPSEIVVIEQDAAKREASAELGCRASDDPRESADADQVLLAVKPQSFPAIASALASRKNRGVFISVMAGLRGARIRAAVGERHAIVRAMPNTACRIGLGMTAIALSDGARAGDDSLATELFASLGHTLHVDESHLDAATAVSGSGPAYLFYLAEAWERAAIELGFGTDDARELVRQTIAGAARMLEDRGAEAAALRAAVTSPGGTTAAAIAVLDAREVGAALRDALVAARDRARELSG